MYGGKTGEEQTVSRSAAIESLLATCIPTHDLSHIGDL